MSFIDAISTAPADADFVAYKAIGGWVIIQRRSDGIWDTCAQTNSSGYAIFVAGVVARSMSLWSHESKQFITGTVDQIMRHAEKLEA